MSYISEEFIIVLEGGVVAVIILIPPRVLPYHIQAVQTVEYLETANDTAFIGTEPRSILTLVQSWQFVKRDIDRANYCTCQYVILKIRANSSAHTSPKIQPRLLQPRCWLSAVRARLVEGI